MQHVYLDHSTYAPPPSRFEPGTPAIAEAIGLGAAVDYLQDLGMQSVHNFEHDLGSYLHERVGTPSWSSLAAADFPSVTVRSTSCVIGCACMHGDHSMPCQPRIWTQHMPPELLYNATAECLVTCLELT